MDPALAELLSTLIGDAIKIIGPAVVAAFATYKATKAQYELRIRELESQHGFKAREALVEHYKQQAERFDAAYASLGNSLGQLLGVSAKMAEDDETLDELAYSMAGIADMYIAMAPFDVQITLRDLKAEGLETTEEFRKLTEYHEVASILNPTRVASELQQNIYKLLEIYSFLSRCNSLTLAARTNAMYSYYVSKSA